MRVRSASNLLTLTATACMLHVAPVPHASAANGQSHRSLEAEDLERILKHKHRQLKSRAEKNREKVKKEYFERSGQILTDEALAAAIQDANDRAGERWSEGNKPLLRKKILGLEDYHYDQGHRETFGFGDRGGDVDTGSYREEDETSVSRPGDRGSGGREADHSSDVGGDEEFPLSRQPESSSQEGRTDFVAFKDLVLVSGASPGWSWNPGRNGEQFWCVGIPLEKDLGCTPATGANAAICTGKTSYVAGESIVVNFDFNGDTPLKCDWIVIDEAGTDGLKLGLDVWSYTCGSRESGQDCLAECPITPNPQSGQVVISKNIDDLEVGMEYQAYLLRQLDFSLVASSDKFTVTDFPVPDGPTSMSLVNCSNAPRSSMLLDYTDDNELLMKEIDGIYNNWCLGLPYSFHPGSSVFVEVCDRNDIYQQWLLVEDDNTWRPYQWYQEPYDLCIQAFPSEAASSGGGSLKLNHCATQIPFGLQRSHYGEHFPGARIPQIFLACTRSTVCGGGSVDDFGCEQIEKCE